MTASESPLARYEAFLARGELAYQVDARGRPVFFPRVLAPADREGPLAWRVSAGLGTVYATTFITPKGERAYNVALIDLDEGYRLMSRVEGIAAELVRIGMRVKARVQPAQGDQGPYPVFDPLEDER
jgi:uncharacterized OB-fold protein